VQPECIIRAKNTAVRVMTIIVSRLLFGAAILLWQGNLYFAAQTMITATKIVLLDTI